MSPDSYKDGVGVWRCLTCLAPQPCACVPNRRRRLMALSTQPYKGARDFYPEDKRAQKYMFSVLRKVVESFGYQEYDAPIVEPIEIYMVLRLSFLQ